MKNIVLVACLTLIFGSPLYARKPFETGKLKVIKGVKHSNEDFGNFADYKSRIFENFPANVINLILSLPEITRDCVLSDSKEKSGCSKGVKIIAIFAIALDLDGDVLKFDFKVSEGKIIDSGERFPIKLRNHKAAMGAKPLNRTAVGVKLLWDLSSAEPGTYTISASADDGCGFCGNLMRKTVLVKECFACN